MRAKYSHGVWERFAHTFGKSVFWLNKCVSGILCLFTPVFGNFIFLYVFDEVLRAKWPYWPWDHIMCLEKTWFSWRNVTKKRIWVGFPLVQSMYNWFISSCMRSADKFILDFCFTSPPRYPFLALFGSLGPSFGVPLALLWRSFGLPSAPWGSRVLPGSPVRFCFQFGLHFPSKFGVSNAPAHKI